MRERVHEFKKINEGAELAPLLGDLAGRPQLDIAYSVETEAELPNVVGGVSGALARTFKVLDPS